MLQVCSDRRIAARVNRKVYKTVVKPIVWRPGDAEIFIGNDQDGQDWK